MPSLKILKAHNGCFNSYDHFYLVVKQKRDSQALVEDDSSHKRETLTFVLRFLLLWFIGLAVYAFDQFIWLYLFNYDTSFSKKYSLYYAEIGFYILYEWIASSILVFLCFNQYRHNSFMFVLLICFITNVIIGGTTLVLLSFNYHTSWYQKHPLDFKLIC